MAKPADNNQSPDQIIDDVLTEKPEDVQVYGRVPADLYAEVVKIKEAGKKSYSELIVAGLRLLVAGAKAKQSKDDKVA